MRGVEWGIFQAGFQCRDDEVTPEYLKAEIIKEIDWFKRYLPSPDEQYFNDGDVAKHLSRICWFRSQAREMIEHAYTLKFLLDEAGYLISVIKTRNPGLIFYKDEFQIVAKPDKSTLTHWR
jgi:hypothetical protein